MGDTSVSEYTITDINFSPAQVLLHRRLTGSIPAHTVHYCPQKEWILTAEKQEKRLSKWNHILIQKHRTKAHELIPLTLGINVAVQGKDKKWDRTGHIVEVLPNRQYRIRMYHSGRMTFRNCRFLREYTAITPEVHQPIPSASLATEIDTPNVEPRPPQINIDPENHQEELPVALNCNLQLPSLSSTTRAVKRLPRALKLFRL